MDALIKAKDRDIISKYGKLKGWDVCNSLGLQSFGEVYILSDYIDTNNPKIREIFGEEPLLCRTDAPIGQGYKMIRGRDVKLDDINDYLTEVKKCTDDGVILRDVDHSGGVEDVLNNCNVNQMFMPEGIEEAEEKYKSIKRVASNNDVNLSKFEVNDKFNLGKANFEILSVKNNTDNSANESSIVVKLNYFKTSYIFMGDATQDIEKEITCDKVDVLKVGHHGSNSSTSSEFLNIIQPKYAIISAGNNAKYNHPTEQVLQRLKEVNILESNIYITKNQGTIWLTSDGQNIEIQTRKDINLDGTGQIGKVDILKYVHFFLFYKV